MKNAKRSKRPNPQAQVFDYLMSAIVDGKLACGARLPTHDTIAKKFKTTRVTVHKALSKLKQDGFVRTFRSKGSFVSDRPPNLYNYGLMTSSLITTDANTSDPSFFRTAVELAPSLIAAQGRRVAIYEDVRPDSFSRDRKRMAEDIRNHRLAGIICLDWNVFETCGLAKLAEEANIPVASAKSTPKGVTVSLDNASFVTRACERLEQLGKSRIAWLVNVRQSPQIWKTIEAEAARRKHTILPEWRLMGDHRFPFIVRVPMMLLMGLPPETRPDALVIADDSLAEEATAGLAESASWKKSPVPVITHSNFPSSPTVATPVIRLGYDVGAFLSACVSGLEQVRAETKRPGKSASTLTALFEEELHALPDNSGPDARTP